MPSLILATTLVPAIVFTAQAQDWEHQVNEHGLHTARVSASGNTPEGPATTTLTVQCAPGKDGSLSIQYAVSSADKMKKFNFGDFEGPGAPASKRKLVSIAVQAPHGAVTLQTAVSGYRVDQGTFVFELAAKTNTASPVTRVTDAIRSGAESVTITVQDSRNRRQTVKTRFPAANAASAVAETVKECGKQ